MRYLGSNSYKPDCLQFLAELDYLQISNYYETVEICVLGHYHLSSIQNIKRFTVH